MKLGVVCQACGIEAPSKKVTFMQNIGMLVARTHKSIGGRLCKNCVHKYFWSMTGITAAIGWLGMISLIIAPCFVISNIVNYLGALGMPPVPPGAAKPKVTNEVTAAVFPHLDEIFRRLGQKEDLADVARDLGPKCGVTPGQLATYVVMFAAEQQRKEKLARSQAPPKGAFPVLPPKQA